MGELTQTIEADFPWLPTLLWGLVVLGITYGAQKYVFRAVKRISNSDKTPLPGGTILANIARVAIWLAGIAAISKVCFNYDLTAFVTALGVGGIALSLGLQDTLSNLIGGVQVSLGGIVKPGDYVEVLSQRGRVTDINWRHTTIVDANGHHHLIPNSLMNKNSLIHLGQEGYVSVAFLLPEGADVDGFTRDALAAVAGPMREYTGAKRSKVAMAPAEELGGLKATVMVDVVREKCSVTDATDIIFRTVNPVAEKYAGEAAGA